MMSRIQNGARAVALIAMSALALASCEEDLDVRGVVDPSSRAGGTLFDSYVALGNSLTAGWQSGGINDSTQRQSYAYLLARQAGARFVYPSLAMPGCPVPATNFGDAVPQTCAFRSVRVNVGPLNNVGVPNAFLFDSSLAFPYDTTRAIATGGARRSTTAAANPLQTILLGGTTQIQLARQAGATFVSLWIGNNDVLGPASVGLLTGLAGASPPLFVPNSYAAYTRAANFVVDSLARATATTLKGAVIIGVVDVAGAPRFFRANALCTGIAPTGLCIPSALGQQVSTITGKSVTILGNCATGGPGANRLISTAMFDQIKQGTYPPIVSCDAATTPPVAAFPPLTPAQYAAAQFGNLFIIDATEEAAISGAVLAINTRLKAKADSLGWAWYDPNNNVNGLPALRTQGVIPQIPTFNDPKNPFGPNMSTDGVHPRRQVHARLANALIDVINAKYTVNIPKITNVDAAVGSP